MCVQDRIPNEALQVCDDVAVTGSSRDMIEVALLRERQMKRDLVDGIVSDPRIVDA